MSSMSGPDLSIDAAIESVEEQFGTMYRRIKTNMRSRAVQVHPELQVMGFVILTTLGQCGPTHAGVLAEMLDIDKGLLSRQLQALEKLGLLERASDPADKRAVILTPSPSAIERVTEVRTARRTVLHDRLRTWDVADVNKLSELLARLNADPV